MCTRSILDANSVSNYMAITAAFSRLFILRKKIPRVFGNRGALKRRQKAPFVLARYCGWSFGLPCAHTQRVVETQHSAISVDRFTGHYSLHRRYLSGYLKKGCPKAYPGALIDHNRADEVCSLFWTTMLLCPAQKVCTFGKLSTIMYGCAVLPRYTLQYLFLRYATERITQCEPTLNYTEGESTTECSSDKDKRILCIIMCWYLLL